MPYFPPFIDSLVLTNGLRGNISLKSLIPRLYGVGNRELLAIAGAFREDKGSELWPRCERRHVGRHL
jgi:hypothetical protein